MTFENKENLNIERELTEQEWEVIEDYTRRFGYPPRPDLSWGHCYVTDEEMLTYAREGLAHGEPVDWSKYFAPLPDGAVS